MKENGMNWLRLTGDMAVNLDHVSMVTVNGLEGAPYIPTVHLHAANGAKSVSIADLTDEGRDWLKALGLIS
jgi:hypothetical protein